MYESFDLTESECLELVRAGLVGRIAVCTPNGPHIIPVNYSVVDDAVVVRTTPYSLLGSNAKGSVMALEVDQFDYDLERGWSVVVRGRCEVVVDPDELEHIRGTWNPTTWAKGGRTLYLRMRWSEMTGRRLGQGWDPLADLPAQRAR
jgi:nitroimidazol reductase NimA-like FMN-containing flavoprotein (pyridoxamine 5'-phosphate oxidase superfamily)